MRKLGLGTLLLAFTLGTVMVAVACVSIAGISLLRRLADEEAVARVEVAGAGAVQAIERTQGRLVTSARLLAERPTLARLLQSNDLEGVVAFLEPFKQTSQLSACAVSLHDRLVAASGDSISWEEVRAVTSPGDPRFLLASSPSGPLLMGAWGSMSAVPGARVFVARFMDDAYAQRTSEKVGLPVAVLARAAVEAAGDSPGRRLRILGLSGERPFAGRVDEMDAYLCTAAIHDPAGNVVGIVEATLSTQGVESSLRSLAGTMILLTVAIAVLATLFSLVLARRIAGPIESLTEACARIGSGDLSSPVPRASGAEIGVLATTMEEMRERILELTTELRRRQAEAEAVLTGIAEGVFAVDRERRIRYLNPQAAALLGIESAEALGRFCGDVLRPQAPDGVRPCGESCPILHARYRGSSRAIEQLMLPGGGRRTVVITSAPSDPWVEDDAAGSAHQFQVMRDETEVEATRRLRDAVLANISHEFRTPLSAQLASLELLRDRLPTLTAAEVRELVLSIERGTLRLTRLIDNLLESTRIEAGQDSLRRHDVALDEVIEEAAELVVPLIEQRKQHLKIDLPYPLPMVCGDAPRLVQVFVNLLANANKFAPAGTLISLAGRVDELEIRLWVDDQGPGLPAGAVSTLFRRFTRSSAEEPDAGGMGLGLFIVKSIVERHGGRVEAESSDAGTRMHVILPLGRSHEDPSR